MNEFLTQEPYQRYEYNPSTKRRPKTKFDEGEIQIRKKSLRRGGEYDSRARTIESQSNQSSAETRRTNHDSMFLPSISPQRNTLLQQKKKDEEFGRNGYIMSHDTDIETIEALAECDLIIQNLRRLRLKSLSSMKRKHFKNKSTFDSPSYQEIKQRNPKVKQSSAQKEVMMFRAWEPSNKWEKKPKLPKKNNQHKKVQQRIELHEQSIDNEESLEEESILPETINLKNKNQYQQNNQDPENREGLQAEQNKVQLQKNQRKQHLLLKYLGKAKLRGAKLHQRIYSFRNKTISIPNKSEEQYEINKPSNKQKQKSKR